MQYRKFLSEWWVEPSLPIDRLRVPVNAKRIDPAAPDSKLAVAPRIMTGAFRPKRLWAYYNRLQPVDAGYLVPLYSLDDIAKRYGLSQAGRRYYRRHLLPEPFDIVRRRSVAAHHWSRFTLMALDVVLADLEKKGRLYFTVKFEDHRQLIHSGVGYMHSKYAEMEQLRMINTADRFGVDWFD